MDIFAADFEYLNTVKVKQEANAALIGTALQTEIFGVNRDRIIAEVRDGGCYHVWELFFE